DRVGLRVAETLSHGLPDEGSRGVFAETEETARKRDDHVKGKHASVGERARIVKRHPAGALDELVTEAALSRPRLRGDQDDGRSARVRLVQSLLEERKIVLAADEARKASRSGTVEAASDLARTAQIEHAHGNAGPLESLFATIEKV